MCVNKFLPDWATTIYDLANYYQGSKFNIHDIESAIWDSKFSGQ